MPGTPRDYRKPCSLCHTPRDVLVRCQIDEEGTWHFLCPGSCWKKVSGGVIDGDHSEEHQFYRYGGMWKNKHEAVSAKKPKSKKAQNTPRADVVSGDLDNPGDRTADSSVEEDVQVEELNVQQSQRAHNSTAETWQSNGKAYTRNDRVVWDEQTWICRKSHTSDDHWTPGRAYSLWKTGN